MKIITILFCAIPSSAPNVFLKQIINIPIVCSHSSFAVSSPPVPARILVPGFHPQLDECYRILKRMCSAYQIDEPGIDDLFISRGKLNLVYTTKEFNGNDYLEDESYIFTGPSIRSYEEQEKLDLRPFNGKKVIFISLGTINTEFISFFKMCIRTFSNTPYAVVMSIGKKYSPSQLGDIPSNFIVRQQVPQLEILKHAHVFISHAGFNSANEALCYGVPIIALPMANDQYMVAKRLVELGTGVFIKTEELTEDSLYNTVNHIISNEDILHNCKRISQSMLKASNSIFAAKQIEKLAKGA